MCMLNGSENAGDEECEFISEQVESFAKEIQESAPLVQTVQNALLEKSNLNNDQVEDVIIDV